METQLAFYKNQTNSFFVSIISDLLSTKTIECKRKKNFTEIKIKVFMLLLFQIDCR
jgi:hypothetical protein